MWQQFCLFLVLIIGEGKQNKQQKMKLKIYKFIIMFYWHFMRTLSLTKILVVSVLQNNFHRKTYYTTTVYLSDDPDEKYVQSDRL